MPLLYKGAKHNETQKKVKNALTRVGLSEKLDQLPKQLSGGQQQRVAIARALINQPNFIIADEPTGALDTHTTDEIMRLFKRLNDEGVTIILVTHDPETVVYCDRLLKNQRWENDRGGAAVVRKYILWRTAFRSIFKNKRRSFLTMVGIIIGIAAVITIVALGNGFKRNILSETTGTDETGQTKYINIKYNDFDNLVSDNSGISQTDKDMVANLPEVKNVSYYKATKKDSNPTVDFYDKNTKLSMTVNPTKETNLSILNGRQLNAADSDSLNKVVVLDEVVAKQLFGSKEAALNKGFDLNGQVFTVVGVSANTSGEIGPQNYEPLAFFQKRRTHAI